MASRHRLSEEDLGKPKVEKGRQKANRGTLESLASIATENIKYSQLLVGLS